MNIKKIFAALLATTLLSSAFVAYAHDFDTRNPVITYTIGDKLTSQEDLTAKSDMLAYNENFDYYPVSINVTDLGRLYLAKGTDYQVINNITFTLKTTDFALTDEDGFEMYTAGVTPSVGGTWSMANDNVNVGYFNMFWEAPKSKVAALASINMYPGTAKSDIANAELDFEVVLALPAGKTLSLANSDLSAVINYYDKTTGDTKSPANITITNDTLTFGKTTPPTPVENPWAFTVTTDVNAKKTNGYIWDVTGTKGDGDLTSFVATFTNEDETATGEDKTLIKTIDGADLAALSNWNTAPAFAIGLKTDKAVTADFTATSTKDGKTINATIAR